MKARDTASYVFLAVAWGLSFLFVLRVVQAFGWVGAAAFRALVAGATLLLLAAATGRRLDFAMGWRALAVVGATRTISAEFAVTVVAVLVGAFVLGERPSAMQVAGAVTIVAGCALVLGLVPDLSGKIRRPQRRPTT